MAEWTQEQLDATLSYADFLISGCKDDFAVYDATRRRKHEEVIELCCGAPRHKVHSWFWKQVDKCVSREAKWEDIKVRGLDQCFAPLADLSSKSKHTEVVDACIEVIENLLWVREQMNKAKDT